MDPLRFVRTLVLCACLWKTCTRGSASDCCEGDVLLLLDSSGSVQSYEFSLLLPFLSELLRPFQLGRGHVRVGLVQVGTEPRLEFDLDAHDSQDTLQEALLSTRQLHGDTNTEAALRLVQSLLRPQAPPTVLLWLTDGVEPGAVDGPMAALRGRGVSVLAVSTGQGNYQLLRRVVTPPIEAHLHFVNIDDISIITEDLREAITEQFGPVTVTVSDSGPAHLRVSWSPVQPEQVQQYHVQYGEIPSGLVQTLTLPSHQSSALLTGLHSDSEYLITISALHSSGQQRAMSVRACTAEALVPLAGLRLTPTGWGSVQVEWEGQGAGLLGYWLSWKNEDQPSSSSSSSLYLPPHSQSTVLTGVGRRGRVCVSPVYAHARGEGLCCTSETV
ncbi:von Willebrand factor A domain-containing 1-like protein [Labeo rohita]|uniref:von Willebrand factor A domain-containing protein 1 n=1 Tax=Labeo rohita TaxID=84645 RepID=A0A498MP75_LABRO|nr:von Willebrand factor A domain-containing 1-like protein [Labeo rohita]